MKIALEQGDQILLKGAASNLMTVIDEGRSIHAQLFDRDGQSITIEFKNFVNIVAEQDDHTETETGLVLSYSETMDRHIDRILADDAFDGSDIIRRLKSDIDSRQYDYEIDNSEAVFIRNYTDIQEVITLPVYDESIRKDYTDDYIEYDAGVESGEINSVRVVEKDSDEKEIEIPIDINADTKVYAATYDTLRLNTIREMTPYEDDPLVTGAITTSSTYTTATYTTTATIDGFTLDPDGTWSFDPSHTAYQNLEKDEIQTITIPVTVTDDKGATDSENLVITITGTNDTPVLDSITEINTNEDNAFINGTITSTDVDDNSTAIYTTTTTIDGFTLNEDGTYSFDPSHVSYQHLEDGVVQTITIPVTVTDDKGATDTENLIIKITGTNDDPILDSIAQVNTTEDGAIVNGTITSTDVDDNATATYSTSSTVGGFTLNPDGTYSFDPSHADHQHIEEGEIKTITIPVTVTDDKGGTDTENLVIKLTGTNDDPVLDSITQVNTTEDGTVINGTITSTDVDDNATATYSTTSTVGGFTLNL
jgi:VCBS repeat-containing protein